MNLPRNRFAAAVITTVAACFFCRPVSGAASSRPTNVVLVHGIYDTGRIFEPMAQRLEKQGIHCLAPSLTPNDCSAGVRALSLQLARAIDARFGKSAPIILVGFSMGGLVTRDYVQNLAPPGRVRGVFLVSPPNHGTLWALFSRGGTRELGVGSRFIQALNQNVRAWRHMPVCTYWTPLDLMIVPATSSLWPAGDTKTILCLCHPWMVRDPRLLADLDTRLAALGTPPSRRARPPSRREAIPIRVGKPPRRRQAGIAWKSDKNVLISAISPANAAKSAPAAP